MNITDQDIRTKEETAKTDPMKKTMNIATAEAGKQTTKNQT